MNGSTPQVRVLHIVHSLSVGGMEQGMITMLNSPFLAGSVHAVCTMRDAGVLADRLPAATSLFPLDLKGRRPTAFLKLAGLIGEFRPDVLHARNWNTWCDATLACVMSGRHAPVLSLGFHGLESDRGFSLKQKWLARGLGMSSSLFTTVSRMGSTQLQRQLGAQPENTHVLTNGVDTNMFAPSSVGERSVLRRTMNIGQCEFVVAMIGSLVPVKDHECALQAIAQCSSSRRPIRVLLAGDGPLRDTLERSAKTLPACVRISFLGERSDVAPILRAADVFVLSSQYEQTSLALLEAMAVGLPVVATDVGDSAQIVRHGQCGLIVPPKQPVAIAHAIGQLIDGPRIRMTFGAAARRRIETYYSIDHMARGYGNYYENIAYLSQKTDAPCAVSRG
jgi:glycosyltransferase involved in cell wall biosynthesis